MGFTGREGGEFELGLEQKEPGFLGVQSIEGMRTKACSLYTWTLVPWPKGDVCFRKQQKSGLEVQLG